MALLREQFLRDRRMPKMNEKPTHLCPVEMTKTSVKVDTPSFWFL
jgi:hypothetical protein